MHVIALQQDLLRGCELGCLGYVNKKTNVGENDKPREPLRMLFGTCWENQMLTCSQKTMSRQHELRGDFHFAVCVVFKGGEVRFVFVGVHLFPVSVISCQSRGEWRDQNTVRLNLSCSGLCITHLSYYFLFILDEEPLALTHCNDPTRPGSPT